ncbi:hypothetical protein HF1_06750 [Mycoplasma haemofelis str. Langford 1]|uniref:Transmembrane protein n=2 Tax=Mycoplasma haemofelis TaxID=29501 RepID=F6FIG9_MYCHI|nr:hypothetical protein [Mycoplasma haemofelis]AEG73017.1 hypothetical protein MHF_0747 [Mycoplasma haemofelis Ohio2]CBY92683.1 hypothetical protein HF1_06750 [Mycoplasma haemofelis str. Langford 1]
MSSSLRGLETLYPFIKRLKRCIRYWWITTVYFYVFLIGILMLANSWQLVATILFLIWALLWLILYWKTHTRTALLRRTFIDYGQCKDVYVLEGPYRQMWILLNIFFWVDICPIPITFVLKFLFWMQYRRFKMKVTVLRKKIISGEYELDEEDISDDPFYDFLIKEGLYQKPERGNAQDIGKILMGSKQVEEEALEEESEEEIVEGDEILEEEESEETPEGQSDEVTE